MGQTLQCGHVYGSKIKDATLKELVQLNLGKKVMTKNRWRILQGCMKMFI